MPFARVENGTVQEEAAALPVAATLPGGSRTGNFRDLPEADQIAAGWYPMREVAPEIDPAYQDHVFSHYAVTPGVEVERHCIAQDRALATVQGQRLAALDREATRRATSGDETMTHNGNTFRVAADSKTNIMGVRLAILAGEAVPEPIRWSTATGGEASFTAAEFSAFALAYLGHELAIDTIARGKASGILTAQTAAEAAAVPLDTGWP